MAAIQVAFALLVGTSFVAVASAVAAPPEVCGSGLDEDSSGTYGSCAAGSANTIISSGTYSGCDLLCPEDDKDRDGYVAADDCDDTNRRIFPGITILDTNYKTCQSDGTYTDHGGSALSNLPTGTNTYFVDCDSGSGTTCSSGSPCGTIAQATSGGSPGSPPASAKTLVAGDRVWWKGTCAVPFSDGTQNVHANITPDGTSGSPIIIHAIPGVTAKINLDASSDFGFYISGDYVTIYGGEYYATAASVGPAIRVASATGVRVEGGYFHDLPGNGDNNHAAIYVASSNALQINRNIIVDVFGQSGNADGKNGIINFHDGGTGTYTGSSFKYNVFSSTRASNSSCGLTDKCFHSIRFKHGLDADEVTGTFDVHSNIMIWPYVGVYIYSTSDVSAKYNLVVEPYGPAFQLKNDSGSGYEGQVEGIVINRNTVYHGQALVVNRDTGNTEDSFTITENVFDDDANPYSAGADDGTGGTYMIERYGADSAIASMLTAMTSNTNCFYNGAATLTFNFFGGDGGGGEGGSSSDGMLSFANWKTNTSEDAGSFSENPTFDSYHRATATNCVNYGYLLVSEQGSVATTNFGGLSAFY